jgi:predicted  nucleic acid-binding Zn-ribbon protein
MTEGVDLYRLQCLDSDGDAQRRRLAEVEAALEESETLRQARQAVERAQAKVHKWALQQRDLELEIEGLSNRISDAEQRLYSGVIKNPKELADLQADVASLRRRRQKLEDDLLEAMVEREEAEGTHAQAQERLGDVEARWSAQQAELMGEREELQGKLAEIERERSALLPKIEAGDLTTYESLRRRKGGMAVVQLSDGACGGCGVAVSPSLEWQLRQGELACCGNCERIIVRA